MRKLQVKVRNAAITDRRRLLGKNRSKVSLRRLAPAFGGSLARLRRGRKRSRARHALEQSKHAARSVSSAIESLRELAPRRGQLAPRVLVLAIPATVLLVARKRARRLEPELPLEATEHIYDSAPTAIEDDASADSAQERVPERVGELDAQNHDDGSFLTPSHR